MNVATFSYFSCIRICGTVLQKEIRSSNPDDPTQGSRSTAVCLRLNMCVGIQPFVCGKCVCVCVEKSSLNELNVEIISRSDDLYVSLIVKKTSTC